MGSMDPEMGPKDALSSDNWGKTNFGTLWQHTTKACLRIEGLCL